MINLKHPEDGRECGDCEICCTVMGVKEKLNKPAGVACGFLNKFHENERKTGCSIYEDKPVCCSMFQCLWLKGAIGELKDRPNQLGVMFDYLRNQQTARVVGNVIIAYEVIEGALDSERMKYWIKKMAERFPVVMHYLNGEKKITGKREQLEKIIVNKDDNSITIR